MDQQERYLENLVRSASPARLRLLLIERALEISESLAAGAKRGSPAEQSTQRIGKTPEIVRVEQSIQLRDILGELLSGVVDKEWSVAKQVADLYVFLLQFLGDAERDNMPQQWESIASVLRLEQETWAEVCERSARGNGPSPATAAVPGAFAAAQAGDLPAAGSLNLQG